MEPQEMSLQLKSHFLRMYQMALTDDTFNQLELQMLYHLAAERGIPKADLDKLFLDPVSPEVDVPEDLHVRIEYLFDLTRIIWADEKITNDERDTLQKYCRKFTFLEENIEELADYLISSVQQGKKKEDIINELNSEV